MTLLKSPRLNQQLEFDFCINKNIFYELLVSLMGHTIASFCYLWILLV